MTERLEIEFRPLNVDPESVCVVFTGNGPTFGARGQEMNGRAGGALAKALEAADFKGKSKTAVELLTPPKLGLSRCIVVGAGKPDEGVDGAWNMLGGFALGQVQARKTSSASFIAEAAEGVKARPDQIAADLAFGALLRHYSFRKYITRQGSSDTATSGDGAANGSGNGAAAQRDGLRKLAVHCADPDAARAAFARHKAIADGVYLARNLVNEPANVLGPMEFADRVRELEKAGVEVEILDEGRLAELGMNSLLAVGQGSDRPSCVAVMQWHGAKSKRAKPLAFVGKGVVFDTGGISIKPAQGMEDMKGDMGGAACVTGLMLALAERKANVNAVGLIGCVENMPSGSATRPGDIVTSMSGQTIEILNTDAEGRLVLADVLWYAQDRFKPRLVIDLATLTGAIMVALGKEYAGLYSNDDKLAGDLIEAGTATGEKVWRMPLDKGFDKLIESKNADMKNIGGRWAGACTAAAFLQKFIKDTPWAHIDLAGTAMDAPRNEINPSWGSGWGVRLLDRFIADNYEKAEKA
jgi:leucyl aminopeptidase